MQNEIAINDMCKFPAELRSLRTHPQVDMEETDLSGLTSLGDLRWVGEPDLVVELIDLYLKDAPERIQSIQAAAARADAVAVKQAAHTLKGSSASLGFHQIAEIAEQLEQLDWRNSHSRFDALTELLQYKFARLREALLKIRESRLS